MTTNKLASKKILTATILGTILIVSTLSVAGMITFSNPNEKGNDSTPSTYPMDAFADAEVPLGTTDTPGGEVSATIVPLALVESISPEPGTTVNTYEGVQTQFGGVQGIAMGGIPAFPAGGTAKTTYIVADGQAADPACVGFTFVITSASFAAGAGPLVFGPPAITGADGVGPPSPRCLWDTETHDVTAAFIPGDVAATASMTSNSDCLTWQVQVLEVKAPGALGGYAEGGVGLRNLGSGTITIAGIPAGASVVKALLYWNILDPFEPGPAMMLDSGAGPTPVAGVEIGHDSDPCWGALTSHAFRADVTALVAGNGAYVVSGYPTGSAAGGSPWAGSPLPMAEGAALVVIFSENKPPDCSGAAPSASTLWPPNHKMNSITITGVTDPDGDPITITIDSIFQDEPVDAVGNGDGNTSPDGAGVGTSTADVRAERAGTGDGRVYHISFTADDGKGGTCSGTVLVSVPHDQSGAAAVDQGALFSST